MLKGDREEAEKKLENTAVFAQQPTCPRWDLEDVHMSIGAILRPRIWDGAREGGARLGSLQGTFNNVIKCRGRKEGNGTTGLFGRAGSYNRSQLFGKGFLERRLPAVTRVSALGRSGAADNSTGQTATR